MLDEEHLDLERDPDDNDENLYALGSIGGHNVVIVCLPAGRIGNNPAAVVATQLRATFQAIRFGLLVGIGGGVPSAEADVRLGDVVVSQPHQIFGGVVQYDSGKATTPNGFERTGSLNSPPYILLSAIAKVRANELRGRSKVVEYISKLGRIVKFRRDRAGADVYFEATYDHEGGPACDRCKTERQQARQPRESEDEVEVHYGTIASGNQVIKSAAQRDKVSAELGGVLCFEMEAAGLMNSFPCLVIRGICDYADSHKNKRWQPYAAGAAASYAKEVLLVISPTDVAKTRTAAEAIQAIATDIQAIKDDTEFIRVHTHDVEQRNLSEWLSPTNYAAIQSDTLGRRQEGTGQWFLDAPEVASWRSKPKATLLCPGIPGAGKTIVAAIAIDSLLKSAQSSSIGVDYVYCNYKSQKEQDVTSLLAAILKQLIHTRHFFADPVKRLHKVHAREGTKPSANEIFTVLQSVILNILDGIHRSRRFRRMPK
jgi:nucleoside phosphorylase